MTDIEVKALQTINRITANAMYCGSSRVKDTKVLIWRDRSDNGQYFTYDDLGHILRADYRSDLIQIAERISHIDGDKLIFDMEAVKI